MDTTNIDEREDNHSVYPLDEKETTTTLRTTFTPRSARPSTDSAKKTPVESISSGKKSNPSSSTTKSVPHPSSSAKKPSPYTPQSNGNYNNKNDMNIDSSEDIVGSSYNPADIKTPALSLGTTPTIGTKTQPITTSVTPSYIIPPELKSARRSAVEGSAIKNLSNLSATKGGGTPRSPVRSLATSLSSDTAPIEPMDTEEGTDEASLLDAFLISSSSSSSSLSSSTLQQQDLLTAMETFTQGKGLATMTATTGRRESLSGSRTQDGILKQLRHLSHILEVCVGPIDTPGVVPRPTKESTEYIRTIPVSTVQQLLHTLQEYIQKGMNLRGILPLNRNAGAPPAPCTLKEEQSIAGINITTIATAFEASLIALLIMSTPNIDGILVSEDLLSSIIRLTRFHAFAHILPCYDALDATWQRNPNEPTEEENATQEGTSRTVTVSSLSSSSTRKLRNSTGKKIRYTSDILEDDDNNDDEDDVDMVDDTDHSPVAPVKVTAAMLATAQKRVRPILLQMCHVIDRLQPIITQIRLGEAMIEVVSELALVTATQTTAIPTRPPRRTVSRRKKTDTGIVTPITIHGAENTLQGSSMVLLQCIFERYSESRKYIINDLSMTHVRLTAGKRFVRDFVIASTLPRPHLPSASSTGTGSIGSGTTILDGANTNTSSATNDNSSVSIHSCTALILHLIHCSVTLPTTDEIKNATTVPENSTLMKVDKDDKPDEEDEEEEEATNNTGSSSKGTKRGKQKSLTTKASSSSSSSKGNDKKRNKTTSDNEDETMKDENKPPSETVITPTVIDKSTNEAGNPKPTVPVTEGYRTAIRLSQQYALNIFRWCEQKIRGETVVNASSSLTVSTPLPTFAEDEDPRIVLRRFVDDLCQIIDIPEWPGAEILLSQLLSFIVNKIKATTTLPTGSGIITNATTTATVTNADRTLSTLCVSLLSPIVVRLQACQSFARRHTLELPPPLPEPTDNDTDDDQRTSEMGCACNREAITGAFHVACDVCHKWFHGACVGIIDGELLEDDFWSCDDCCMRSQIRLQQDRSNQVLTSRSTDALALAEKKQYNEKKSGESETVDSVPRKKGKTNDDNGTEVSPTIRKAPPPPSGAVASTSDTVRTPSTPVRHTGSNNKTKKNNRSGSEDNDSLDAHTGK